LWLIKVWFSASTFVVKIATFAKRQNVGGNSNRRRADINQQIKTENQAHPPPDTI
jgi:hypothetical protein